MQFIENFKKAIDKRIDKKSISFISNNKNNYSKNQLQSLTENVMPNVILEFLTKLNGVTINEPRSFKILELDEIKVIENRYLLFAIMHNKEKICFDTNNLNSANEWDIISYENKFLITKTISSYLTNKVWAWIDRERIIWEEEIYD
jgi:hypothetical protein